MPVEEQRYLINVLSKLQIYLRSHWRSKRTRRKKTRLWMLDAGHCVVMIEQLKAEDR